MFFVNVSSLAYFYQTNQLVTPLYVLICSVLGALFSFFIIGSSIKLSLIDYKKIDYSLVDNIPEGDKKYKVLPGYFNALLILVIGLYSVVGYYCYNSILINHFSLLDVHHLIVQETLFFSFMILINLYYFIYIYYINSLIKKYGITRNKD